MASGSTKTVMATVVIAGLLCTCAEAKTVYYSDSVALTKTDWTALVSVPKFDCSLGILKSVTCKLSGHVEGITRLESGDSEPATVTMDIWAIMELLRPDSSTIVTAIPSTTISYSVSAFDGELDFAGPSGRTSSDLTAELSETVTSSSPTDLALFTGVGDIDLPIVADASTTGSGAGNLTLRFAMSASADMEVVYNYASFAPEPGALAMLLLGIPAIVRRSANRERRH